MTHLTREQRYTISAMLQQNYRQIDIAKAVGKSKSVISREISRNKNDKGKYALPTLRCADVRKERYRTPHKFNKEVENRIKELLELHWSQSR